MPDSYIIRAAIEAADTSGIFARDLFNCGVNDRSEHYPSADGCTGRGSHRLQKR